MAFILRYLCKFCLLSLYKICFYASVSITLQNFGFLYSFKICALLILIFPRLILSAAPTTNTNRSINITKILRIRSLNRRQCYSSKPSHPEPTNIGVQFSLGSSAASYCGSSKPKRGSNAAPFPSVKTIRVPQISLAVVSPIPVIRYSESVGSVQI